MIKKIDMFFYSIFSFVVKILCGITGKSNFFFAKLVTILGIINVILTSCVAFVANPTPTVGLAAGFFVLVFGMVGFMQFKNTEEYEKQSLKYSDDIAIDIHLEKQFDRVLAMVFCLIIPIVSTYNLQAYLFNLALFFYVANLYFVICNYPKKKSWVRAGAEKLAKAIRNIHLPSPLPKPIPLPVRV